jgi:hypothetical protein
MARKAKPGKADRLREKAVDYFAARSHGAWRRTLLKTNPEQKGQPRMRLRGGVMVDVNQPWSKLHPKAQADNRNAAYDAYDAVKMFPNDREAAAHYVHQRWMKRNKADPSQPKNLFRPYDKLPEVEKDKDRAHVDNMNKALAAVRKPRTKKSARSRTKRPHAPAAEVRLGSRSERRLRAAARDLSRALGREVPVDLLLDASVEAVATLCKSLAAQARQQRRRS